MKTSINTSISLKESENINKQLLYELTIISLTSIL